MDDGFLFFIVPMAILGIILYFFFLHEKKRTEKLKNASRKLGLSFTEKGDLRLVSKLENLFLFSHGHGKKMYNIFQGTKDSTEIMVFDYNYTVGGGKNSTTHRQTVILFKSEKLGLPQFTLRPENIFHKIGSSVFKHQDIDFDTYPEFSGKYLLQGKSEPEIRNVFRPEIISFYERKKEINTEGKGNYLIYYEHSKRLEPDDIRAFISEGIEVFRLFADN